MRQTLTLSKVMQEQRPSLASMPNEQQVALENGTPADKTAEEWLHR
jgi:hypothetical protein